VFTFFVFSGGISFRHSKNILSSLTTIIEDSEAKTRAFQ